MKILAIETSCDETGIAVLEKQGKKKNLDFKVLSNILISQINVHQKYGGVYPVLAKREHQKNLTPVLKRALFKAKLLQSLKNKNNTISPKKLELIENILEKNQELLSPIKKFLLKYKKPDINVIAVTIGPGLEPCLWVGVNFAKILGLCWNVPIIPVNHIEAHILANWIKLGNKNAEHRILSTKKLFPAICLIVSGGHTQLILMNNYKKYKIIGETRDDAAGECFDKTARILGLSYPGGPVIEKMALKYKTNKQKNKYQIKLPSPMLYTKNYDFSFSGLKTAVLYEHKKRSKKTRQSVEYIEQMSATIQQKIIDVLIKKTIMAVKDFRAETIILGGGVIANKELRSQFKEKLSKQESNINLFLPNRKLCTDNAIMIGVAGFCNLDKQKNWKKINVIANLSIGLNNI